MLERARRNWKIFVTSTGALILVAAGIFIFFAPEVPSAPNDLGVYSTNNLLTTSGELKKSLEVPTDNKKRTVTNYLGLMARMTDECKRLESTLKTLENKGETGDTVTLLKNSSSLCLDLVDLTTTSTTIYTATLPVVSDNSKVKRYQTLPVIKSRVIADNKKDVATAIKTLEKSKKGDAEYVKLVLEDLATLKTSMDRSKDFSYLTSLEAFQNQHLADRHQYWTGYGDLSGLIKALQNQLIQYCNNTPSDKPIPTACEAAAKG